MFGWLPRRTATKTLTQAPPPSWVGLALLRRPASTTRVPDLP
jgi:hypothetical protein